VYGNKTNQGDKTGGNGKGMPVFPREPANQRFKAFHYNRQIDFFNYPPKPSSFKLCFYT
jgi:hypothetical protein